MEGIRKGCHLSLEGIRKGYPSMAKMVFKRVKGRTSGEASLHDVFLSTPPGIRGRGFGGGCQPSFE